MNYDKIDTLLMAAGCRFEFLHVRDYEDFSPYKFAELIVRECLEVVRRSDDECYDEWDYADRDLCGIIKQHFGVEE